MSTALWDDTYTVRNIYNYTEYFKDFLNFHKASMLTRSASGEVLRNPFNTTSTDDSNSPHNQNDPYLHYIGLFSNSSEQMLGIQTPVTKVLIYDSRTGYFNASHLVQALNKVNNVHASELNELTDISTKDFSKLLHFKGFADTLEMLEVELNAEQEYINKSLPNYDEKRTHVVACYNLKHDLFGGTFVHPALLSFVMMYANHEIMLDMSMFMLSFYNKQVSNSTLNITSSIEHINSIPEQLDQVRIDKINTFKYDLLQKQHEDKIRKKEARKKKTTEASKNKSKTAVVKRTPKRRKSVMVSASTDVKEENVKGNSGIDECLQILSEDTFEVDALIDSIDNSAEKSSVKGSSVKGNSVKGNSVKGNSVKKGSSKTSSPASLSVKAATVNNSASKKRSSKRSVPSRTTAITHALIILIPTTPPEDLQEIKFFTCLMEDLKKYEKQVPKGWEIYSTFINLRNLPTDLARRFNKDFEDSVETDIRIEPNGEVVLLIDSLESFDENIHGFLSDWMVI